MDVLKLAIFAFIAAGIVLAMSGVGQVRAVLISGGITIIFMLIAIYRTRKKPEDKDEDDTPAGPTIK